MKNITFIICLVFFSTALLAQQDQQYTQFMFNKLNYNPAFAGSQNAACATALVRSQWIGLDGAPNTQVLSFNMPLSNQRVGVGGNIVRNTIGISESITVDGDYAYRFRVGQGMLGVGMNASVRLLRADFNDVTATQPTNSDQSIPIGRQSKFLPNFGVGAYYTSDKFYLGFSIPRLLTNNIDFSDDEVVISRESRHYYLMGGFIVPLGENLKLQPQALLKSTSRAPFDADVNLSLIIMDKFTVGATYRIGGSSISSAGESIDVLIAAQVSENILFGVSYDVTLSDLRSYNSGSIEAALRYCIGGSSDVEEYSNPRFF